MLAPRTPRAPLVSLLTVAALATLAAADNSEIWHRDYVTMLHKGPDALQPDDARGPFYIPDGQCSGVLDALLRCPPGTLVRAVRVRVQDAAGYARVALRDDLRAASVVRVPPCAREAAVTVRLACHPPFH